jgi:pyruvate dehydrogenase E1 component
MPEGVEEGILKGAYLYQAADAAGAAGAAKVKSKPPVVQLMGSGTILREVIAAAELLKTEFAVESEIWSMPGINGLHRDAVEAERYNLTHPESEARIPYLTKIMQGHEGPVVISTDYIRAYPEQIRRLIPQRRVTILGTDGFGRSDTRAALRRFFEVDRYYIALAALKGLADEGAVPVKTVGDAIAKFGIDVDKPNPLVS